MHDGDVEVSCQHNQRKGNPAGVGEGFLKQMLHKPTDEQELPSAEREGTGGRGLQRLGSYESISTFKKGKMLERGRATMPDPLED